MRIRKEEYTALGDFLLPAFTRDQADIVTQYPKLDAAFLNAFQDKLRFVKRLESSIVITEKQRKATATLYEMADELNSDLTRLNSYVKDARLNSSAITALKTELFKRNIEGAVLLMEGIIQYITEHKTVLETEGMLEGMIEKLTNYKEEMEAKNTDQNLFMNQMKELTDRNLRHYEELYEYMAKIAEKGKLVFKNTVKQDEYTLSKNISRMRAPLRIVKDSEPTAVE